MIFVDSSIWIDNLRQVESPQVRTLRTLRTTRQIVVGDLILLEILQGAFDDTHAARLEGYLRRFRVERMVDDVLAVRAAQNYRTLRRHGTAVRRTMDLIIATFCIERGYALLHDDRDFEPMVARLGLRVI